MFIELPIERGHSIIHNTVDFETAAASVPVYLVTGGLNFTEPH